MGKLMVTQILEFLKNGSLTIDFAVIHKTMNYAMENGVFGAFGEELVAKTLLKTGNEFL